MFAVTNFHFDWYGFYTKTCVFWEYISVLLCTYRCMFNRGCLFCVLLSEIDPINICISAPFLTHWSMFVLTEQANKRFFSYLTYGCHASCNYCLIISTCWCPFSESHLLEPWSPGSTSRCHWFKKERPGDVCQYAWCAGCLARMAWCMGQMF